MCATITKLEAAHRQLITAIKMYLADGDAVAVHTLACAAREIYEQHCKNLELDRMFGYIKAAHPKHEEKDLWNVLNGARNFFKHPGDSLDETIEISDSDNAHMIFIACHDCAVLCEENAPAETQAFSFWYMATVFPLSSSGAEVCAADEVASLIDQFHPGLREVPLVEQKRIGLKMLADAAEPGEHER